MYTINRLQTYVSRVTAAMAVACTLSVFMYGVFLLMAVNHAAARTEAQREITKITAGVGDLETNYLSQTKEITPERAAALGFVEPSSVTTVYVTNSLHTLSINTNR